MKLQYQLSPLPQSIRLKELGVVQGSLFYHTNDFDQIQHLEEAILFAHDGLKGDDSGDEVGKLRAEVEWLGEAVPKWIDVKDRLPIAGIDVWVSDVESDIVTTGWYNKFEGWFTDKAGVGVTHWMPIQPPALNNKDEQ